MGDGAPEEVWQLVVPQASGLTLTVAAPTWDAAVSLLSGSSCLTAGTYRSNSCTDTAGNVTETLTLDLVPAGTYWVVVDGFVNSAGVASSGAYTLTATLTPGGGACTPDGLDNQGRGNTLATAPALTQTSRNDAGEPLDLNLNLCGADEDWFGFYAQGTVTVRAVAQPLYVGTVSTAVQSVTFDAAGSPVGAAFTAGVSAQNGITTITNAPAGTYAVRNTATGSNATGIRYSFNILHACEPDLFEGLVGNNLATTSGPPVARDIVAGDLTLRVCPADVDLVLFNSSASGTGTIRLTGASALNVTALGVVRDAAGEVTGVTMNPAGVTVATQGADKVVTWATTVGALLMLRVEAGAGAVPAAGAPYGLVVDLPDVNNDLCANAVVVTLPAQNAGPVVVFGDTSAYASERDPPSACSTSTGDGPDAYYTFTAPAGATGRVRAVVGGGDYDTVLYVVAGDCTVTNTLACNDDEDAGNDVFSSTVTFAVTGGQRYTVVVDSYTTGAPYGLSLEALPPP